MNESKILNIITPHQCPHCSKEIVISAKLASPWIDWVLKSEDVTKAKQTVIGMVEKSTTINTEEKKSLLAWLNDKNTLFGPSEIEAVLKQIINKPDEKNK